MHSDLASCGFDILDPAAFCLPHFIATNSWRILPPTALLYRTDLSLELLQNPFAAHQNTVDTSSDCTQDNRASTLRLTAVGALCFQLTSCSPSKLMTAGSGRNRGELVPRLNRILDSVWTAIPLLRQLAVAASTDSLQLA